MTEEHKEAFRRLDEAIAAIGKASTDTLMPSPERWAAAKIVRDYLFELRGRMEAAVADVGGVAK